MSTPHTPYPIPEPYARIEQSERRECAGLLALVFALFGNLVPFGEPGTWR